MADAGRTYLLRFDGGTRGNGRRQAGASGCGAVLLPLEGEQPLASRACFLSADGGTNNWAEYHGLCLGLEMALLVRLLLLALLLLTLLLLLLFSFALPTR